jgi:hypothetical protein
MVIIQYWYHMHLDSLGRIASIISLSWILKIYWVAMLTVMLAYVFDSPKGWWLIYYLFMFWLLLLLLFNSVILCDDDVTHPFRFDPTMCNSKFLSRWPTLVLESWGWQIGAVLFSALNNESLWIRCHGELTFNFSVVISFGNYRIMLVSSEEGVRGQYTKSDVSAGGCR